MATTITPVASQNKYSEQNVFNKSYDTDFDVLATEQLGYDSGSNVLRRIRVNSDGELITNLETGDIEIGAVEIKNATDDTRATVGANGLYVDPRTGFTLPPYDYCSQVQASTTDTWTFKTGGAGGTTVATITITYTGTDKLTISNVAKT
jgi:hypothetical protein